MDYSGFGFSFFFFLLLFDFVSFFYLIQSQNIPMKYTHEIKITPFHFQLSSTSSRIALTLALGRM